MTEHIGTPWKVSVRDQIDPSSGVGCMQVIDHDGLREIAQVCGPQRRARAHLIAAAPELLDVVRDVVRMTESADVHEVDLSNFVASARAAIARAEGRP